MALTEDELRQINDMIASYRRTIKFIRAQILSLERQKIDTPKMNHKFKFNTNKKEKK